MDTASRLLQLLTLLSARATWRADQLADRLEVTERSIRRDITRLRALGYQIDSVTGPYGGYSLAAGTRLPPLQLDDDEAVAIAVALHASAHRAPAALAEGALRALTKLGHVMPATMRERVSALADVVVDVNASRRAALDADDGPGQDADNPAETLITLALACSREERVRFDYLAAPNRPTTRSVEPYRLVAHGSRWYLVAYDLDRTDWRTFRVDRVDRVRNNGERFARGSTPDAAALVAAGIAVRAYDERAVVRFSIPVARLARHIPPTIGVISADPDDPSASLAEIGGDLDWIARYLVSLPLECEVIEPPGMAAELVSIGTTLIARYGPH